MHDALDELDALDATQAAVVRARFYAGLTFAEVAERLGVSESTVYREWEAASALLKARLRDVA